MLNATRAVHFASPLFLDVPYLLIDSRVDPTLTSKLSLIPRCDLLPLSDLKKGFQRHRR
jgi:hypothetical protein